MPPSAAPASRTSSRLGSHHGRAMPTAMRRANGQRRVKGQTAQTSRVRHRLHVRDSTIVRGRTVHRRSRSRLSLSSITTSVFFYNDLGVHRRCTLRGLKVSPRASSCRNLSDATLRSVVALSVGCRHAPDTKRRHTLAERERLVSAVAPNSTWLDVSTICDIGGLQQRHYLLFTTTCGDAPSGLAERRSFFHKLNAR